MKMDEQFDYLFRFLSLYFPNAHSLMVNSQQLCWQMATLTVRKRVTRHKLVEIPADYVGLLVKIGMRELLFRIA